MSAVRLPAAILALVFVAVLAAPAWASPGYDKGLEDGRKFGQEAGQAKGQADGKNAGDAAGFARGMEDERTGQPDPGTPPPAPPTPSATDLAASLTGAAASDADSADRLGQAALTRYPDLMPRASETATTAAGAPDQSTQYGLDYSKGFAVGLATGFAETYPLARVQAYQEAYPAGYARGRAEYRRLYRREDGTVIGPQAQVQLARQAILLGHYQEAIERLDIAIAAEGAAPVLAEALYYKARAYFDWSKPREALKVLGKLLTGFADSGYGDDGYFLAGASYEKTPASGLGGLFGQRCWAQARDSYWTLTVKYPQTSLMPDALLRLGYTCEQTSRKAAAIKAYKTLIERFPDNPLAEQARVRLKRLER
jgi:tetratricopeptide (TPR) repeat protein